MDEDGYFYIVDRKKDMIIAGGFNIYPREVDEVLYEHPRCRRRSQWASRRVPRRDGEGLHRAQGRRGVHEDEIITTAASAWRLQGAAHGGVPRRAAQGPWWARSCAGRCARRRSPSRRSRRANNSAAENDFSGGAPRRAPFQWVITWRWMPIPCGRRWLAWRTRNGWCWNRCGGPRHRYRLFFFGLRGRKKLEIMSSTATVNTSEATRMAQTVPGASVEVVGVVETEEPLLSPTGQVPASITPTSWSTARRNGARRDHGNWKTEEYWIRWTPARTGPIHDS